MTTLLVVTDAIAEERAALRGLLAKASPRPWTRCEEHPDAACSITIDRPDGNAVARVQPGYRDHVDAALIAAAVNALPGLLDDIDRLEAEVARWTADEMTLGEQQAATIREAIRLIERYAKDEAGGRAVTVGELRDMLRETGRR